MRTETQNADRMRDTIAKVSAALLSLGVTVAPLAGADGAQTWRVATSGQWGSISESETGWVLSANVASASAVEIRGISAVGASPVLDFTDTDGFTLAGVGQAAFTTDSVAECVLPDTVTRIGKYAFQNCVNLAKITLGKGLSALDSTSFMGCSKLREIVCRGFPFSSDYAQSANLGYLAEYAVRVFYPATDENWGAFVKSSYVTGWDALDASVKEKYAFADGITPVGLSARTGLKNLWLVSSGGADDSVRLVVDAEGTRYGVADPAYGDEPVEYQMGALPVACSVTSPVGDGSVLHRCAGYRLMRFVDGAWTGVGGGPGASCSLAPSEPGDYKLVWLWEDAGYRIPSMADFDGSALGGSVSVASDAAALEGGYWPAGATVTYEAAGATPFSRWFGDVSADAAHSATLAVKMDAPRDFVPVFRTDWTVADDGKAMSDGYWTLAIEVGGGAGIRVGSGATSLRYPGVLDLTKPVSCGLPVTEIGADAFKGNTRLLEALLPAGLTSIGNSAFDGCSALTRVDPLLPDSVASVGIAAFSQCTALAGDLTIGGRGGRVNLVESKWAYQFRDCRNLRSVTFGKGVEALRPYSFWNCTGLQEMRFCGKPSIWGTQAQAGGSFQGIRTYRKVHLPRSDADWAAWMSDGALMTPWSSLDADTRKRYADSFPGGPLPKGLSTESAPFGVQWIFTFSDKRGLTLVLR